MIQNTHSNSDIASILIEYKEINTRICEDNDESEKDPKRQN